MEITSDQSVTGATLKLEMANTIILSNVAELASSVLAKMAGSNIANTINGSTVTKAVISGMVIKRASDLISSGVVSNTTRK